MLYTQEVFYNYTRIKNLEDSSKGDIIFLYLKLSVSRRQQIGDTLRSKVDNVISKIVRVPYSEAPIEYKNLPTEDYIIDITKEEFQRLEKLAKDDFIAFASYHPYPSPD